MSAEQKNFANTKPPPLLSGIVLLFWGILTGHIVVGALLAIAMESHRLTPSRWEVSDDMFQRIWNLCFVLFIGTAVVSLFRAGAAAAIYICVRWLPLLMFPIALAQVYATRDVISTSAFSFIARYMHKANRPAGGQERPVKQVNIEYIYMGVVIIAAGAANRPGLVFYAGTVCLVGFALWRHANRRVAHPLVWFLSLLLVAGLGYAGYLGLHELQLALERTGFLAMLPQGEMASNAGFTRIGSVGKLKLSSAVAWRLRTEAGKAPMYLRTDSYDSYRKGIWFSRRAMVFRPLPTLDRGPDPSSWDFRRGKPDPLSRVTLLGKSSKGRAFLSLPGTPLSLRALPAGTVATNAMASVRARDVDRLLHFQVDFDDSLRGDIPPTEEDVALPDEDREGLRRVVDTLGFGDMTPRETLNHLHLFFRDNFTYTTYLTIQDRDTKGDAIIEFLERERRGHCEYFATATVLLLREAGIPARYVTGYGVTEYNKTRKEYVIRGLHAHAWAQAWVDGKWEFVENTPASWSGEEQASISFFQPVKDWFARLPHGFTAWRTSDGGKTTLKGLQWGGIPLVAFYLWWRIFKGQRLKRGRKKKAKVPVSVPPPGLTSDCYELETCLAEIVGDRPPGEPLRQWWRRIRDKVPDDLDVRITRAIQLHYRWRFGPDGLDDADREQLRVLVAECKGQLVE